MAKDTAFHGWTVETDSDGNRIVMTKASDHPSANNGRLVVIARGGSNTPAAITRAVAERDALAEDVRMSSPDDRETWEFRQSKATTKLRDLRADNLAKQTAG